MKNRLFKYLHPYKLCPKTCSLKYPWGWKSKSEIKKVISKPIKNNIVFNSVDDRDYIHEINFKKHSTYAFKVIYTSYLENYNFLDYDFTTPSLSIAINKLRESADVNTLDEYLNINNCNILNIWYEYGWTKTNSKFLGFFNKNELINEIIIGGIGPEIKELWDQKPIKQKVLIEYDCNKYKHVVEWERNLMFKDQNWQICNINGIIN